MKGAPPVGPKNTHPRVGALLSQNGPHDKKREHFYYWRRVFAQSFSCNKAKKKANILAIIGITKASWGLLKGREVFICGV